MSTFKVLSNLNHNGTVYVKGSTIEGEIATFAELVKIGVLADLDGVAPAEAAKEEAPVAEVTTAAPKDTWGPQPDVVPEAPKQLTAEEKAALEAKAPEAPKDGLTPGTEGQNKENVDATGATVPAAPATTEGAGATVSTETTGSAPQTNADETGANL